MSKKICIWSDRQTSGVHGTLGAALAIQPESTSNPKTLLIKVAEYDSLTIKIPIMGKLTYCLAWMELLSEATATPTPRHQRSAW